MWGLSSLSSSRDILFIFSSSSPVDALGLLVGEDLRDPADALGAALAEEQALANLHVLGVANEPVTKNSVEINTIRHFVMM